MHFVTAEVALSLLLALYVETKLPGCVLKLFFHTVTGKAGLTLHYCVLGLR